jgi:hypothetical protein
MNFEYFSLAEKTEVGGMLLASVGVPTTTTLQASSTSLRETMAKTILGMKVPHLTS